MIKKELCIKCWNKIYEWEEWEELWLEEHWGEKEYVQCPFKYLEGYERRERKITDKPPKNCPFYLENII